MLGDVRTVEPMEGFLKASRGEKAFADLLDRHVFCTGEAMRGDVSVNIATCIGDVLQGGRQHLLVDMLSSGCMVEAVADQALEFIQARCAERLRECGDQFAASTVFVSRE